MVTSLRIASSEAAKPIEGDLAPDHEQEWLMSGVDPEIIRRNVRSLQDTEFDPFTRSC